MGSERQMVHIEASPIDQSFHQRYIPDLVCISGPSHDASRSTKLYRALKPSTAPVASHVDFSAILDFVHDDEEVYGSRSL